MLEFIQFSIIILNIKLIVKGEKMSIFKARLNGKDVYANKGEELRGQDVTCRHCGAKMHIHRFPNSDEYHFSLNPGEKHTSVCENYDADKDEPVLAGMTPADLIKLLSTATKTKQKTEKQILKKEEPSFKEKQTPNGLKVRKIGSLKQIVNAGYYDEKPFEPIFEGEQLKFIDFFIFFSFLKLCEFCKLLMIYLPNF